jgi:hypothetical protein
MNIALFILKRTGACPAHDCMTAIENIMKHSIPTQT